MRKIIWTLLLLGLTAGVAHAGRFDTVNYQCAHLNHKTDGVGCRVVDRVDGPTLLIKIHDKGEHWRKRTKYVVGVVTHNFLALGGTWIEERATRPDGRLVQRNCSRVKYRDFESCRAWFPVKP